MALSRSFSALLTASTDGEVLLWDLNRLEFVRKLASGSSVSCARINDVTGNILVCRNQTASIYTLNGSLLVTQNICDPGAGASENGGDVISACAFYEGTGNEWLERDIIFTGHRRGVAKVWSLVVSGDAKGKGKENLARFEMELIKRLDHVNQFHNGTNTTASISCILPMANCVYTGDEEGRVVS
jgi:beige protein homolog 1